MDTLQGDSPTEVLAAIAGRYECGPSYFAHCWLSVGASGGYTWTFSHCVGNDKEWGVVFNVDGLLRLHRDASSPLRCPESPLVPIAWGERRYLISMSEMPAFCHDIRRFAEPRYTCKGSYLLRSGDHLKLVANWPRLPGRIATLLRRQPLRGTVLEPLEGFRARVDLGSDAGLAEGMTLYVRDRRGTDVRVVSVETDSCVVEADHPIRRGIQADRTVTCHYADEGQPLKRPDEMEPPWAPPLYLIVAFREWERAQGLGEFRGGSAEAEGRIRCLTPDLIGRADMWLLREPDAEVLLEIDPGRVRSPVRWEVPSSGEQLYPYVDGPLNTDAVVKVKPLK